MTRLLLTPAPDDSGARTADLFEWQAAVAAADGLAATVLHLDDRQGAVHTPSRMIICEHHEDYVVLCDHDVELVSVKHRELSRGAWTWAALPGDGGLAHLFARWIALERSCRCRLVTNAGLAPGDPTRLVSVCAALAEDDGSGPDPAAVDGVVRAFAVELICHADTAKLPLEWRGQPTTTKANISPCDDLLAAVWAFLAVLHFDTGRPHRNHMGAAAPETYAEPLLELLRLPVEHARAVWSAVVDVFRRRMTARGPVPLGGLAPLVAAAQGETARDALARELRARRVGVEDILIAVRTAATAPAAYTSLDVPPAATKLAMKLTEGGCTPTTVRTAESLASQWRHTRHERVGDVPGVAADFAAAELQLRQLASAAAEIAASSATRGRAYGPAMWLELNRTVTADALARLPFRADNLLALGGVCDLASRCQVWFGPEFDVLAAQERARARAGRIAADTEPVP